MLRIALGLVLCVLVLVGANKLSAWVNRPAPAVSAPPTYDAAARAACKQFIGRKAHDPASIDWGDYWGWTALQNADGSWSVGARFRAKNGLGAMQLTYVTCVMQRNGDNWQLVSANEMR